MGLWIALFVISGFLMSTLLAKGETTEFVFVNNPESKVGLELLENRLRGPTGTNEIVVIESDAFTVDDPAFRELVEGITNDIAALGDEVIRPETLANFYRTGAPPFVSADRSATLISFVMAGDFDNVPDHIKEVVEAVEAHHGQEGFRVLPTGQATIGLDFRDLGQEDLEAGEIFGVPIAVIILILVLEALAAAFILLLLAIVSIVVALGVASLVAQAFELSFFVRNIITMIGLAVAIDFSLFVVSWYREERAKGLDQLDAISRSGATAPPER